MENRFCGKYLGHFGQLVWW